MLLYWNCFLNFLTGLLVYVNTNWLFNVLILYPTTFLTWFVTSNSFCFFFNAILDFLQVRSCHLQTDDFTSFPFWILFSCLTALNRPSYVKHKWWKWFVLKKVSCTLEKNVCSAVVDWSVLYISFRYSWLQKLVAELPWWYSG